MATQKAFVYNIKDGFHKTKLLSLRKSRRGTQKVSFSGFITMNKQFLSTPKFDCSSVCILWFHRNNFYLMMSFNTTFQLFYPARFLLYGHFAVKNSWKFVSIIYLLSITYNRRRSILDSFYGYIATLPRMYKGKKLN